MTELGARLRDGTLTMADPIRMSLDRIDAGRAPSAYALVLELARRVEIAALRLPA